jgi:hypothetical protein
MIYNCNKYHKQEAILTFEIEDIEDSDNKISIGVASRDGNILLDVNHLGDALSIAFAPKQTDDHLKEKILEVLRETRR